MTPWIFQIWGMDRRWNWVSKVFPLASILWYLMSPHPYLKSATLTPSVASIWRDKMLVLFKSTTVKKGVKKSKSENLTQCRAPTGWWSGVVKCSLSGFPCCWEKILRADGPQLQAKLFVSVSGSAIYHFHLRTVLTIPACSWSILHYK